MGFEPMFSESAARRLNGSATPAFSKLGAVVSLESFGVFFFILFGSCGFTFSLFGRGVRRILL